MANWSGDMIAALHDVFLLRILLNWRCLLLSVLTCSIFFVRELEIARRKKRWRLKEAQLRAERNRGTDGKANNVSSSHAGHASHCEVVECDPATADEDKTLQQLYHDPSMKSRQPKQVRQFFCFRIFSCLKLARIMKLSCFMVKH